MAAKRKAKTPVKRVPRDNFAALVKSIRDVHEYCEEQASRAVNISLTLRNWIIGGCIHRYELKGLDRARYGDRLMAQLSEKLTDRGVPTCEPPRLYAYLTLFRTYPQIRQAMPNSLHDLVPVIEMNSDNNIFRSLTGKSQASSSEQIFRSLTGKLAITGEMLLRQLSYTHLELLMGIDDPLKRAFYEIECIRGCWSVRSLKRQLATLYFERSGLSKNKNKLSEMVRSGEQSEDPKLAIRDPYIFEFLGLRAKEAVSELDVEDALLDHLQEFILELGHGFCLEARQKCITIGSTRGSVDLVFYHRVLRCHVLIELKVDEFTHEHLGQLNTYVSWYRRHMMNDGDNPPVGILLCTGKDNAFVEYALASLDNRLFVSKYEVALPSRRQLLRFLRDKRTEMER